MPAKNLAAAPLLSTSRGALVAASPRSGLRWFSAEAKDAKVTIRIFWQKVCAEAVLRGAVARRKRHARGGESVQDQSDISARAFTQVEDAKVEDANLDTLRASVRNRTHPLHLTASHSISQHSHEPALSPTAQHSHE